MQKSNIEEVIVQNTVALRKKRKKTQRDIANVLNVTAGYIGQVESLKSPSMYSYDQLNELAKFFECSPKDFMPERAIEE
ncbi:MAG TPA: helix-turn-helix transcriptional regulator [Sphingobacterium sp.]|jgi:transcriptional regulator with XRE-family HTH domain|nr:helix-turn-helix transcriptional regulator [Sphingobacterium sp.]